MMSAHVATHSTGPSRLFHAEPPAAAASAARFDPDQGEVDAALRGEMRAFEALYCRHAGRIHGVMKRLSGHDVARAEEWTQEAFMLAWQRLATFRGESLFATWLHRLAINVALMSLRSSRRGDAARADWDDDVTEVAHVAPFDHALCIDLGEAVARLPPRARAVLVLHDVEGWKHQEIAGELDIAIGTSKAQLHRARALLRKHLESNA